MEKSKLKAGIVVGLAVAVMVVVGGAIGIYSLKGLPSTMSTNGENYFHSEEYDGETYYIIDGDYSGEYNIQCKSFDSGVNSFSVNKSMTYDEYVEYCDMWGFDKKYSDKNKNYIVFSYAQRFAARIEVRLAGVTYNDKIATLYIWDKASGVVGGNMGYVIVIPIDIDIDEVEFQNVYTLDEFDQLRHPFLRDLTTVDKPIIYLYPEKETNITVKLGMPGKLTCTYPAYTEKGWNVVAKPDGSLLDLDTGRNLYALYYESEAIKDFKIEKDGFVVKSEDTIEFLEEKLEILGLTEREAEEFIVYWLPRLQENNYNYIRFATIEEIEENMPLDFSTEPDTLIRVLMTYKGLDTPIDVEEQQLITPKRDGFVVVEWGGTEAMSLT